MTRIRKFAAAFLVALTVIAGAWFIYSGRCIKWAIDHHSPNLLKAFLVIGAPVNAGFGAYGRALTHAVSTGGIDEIGILVKHGANLNEHPFSDLLLLAWAYDVAHGPEVGEELLKLGADVDALAIPSKRKTTLMHLLSHSELSASKIRSILHFAPNLDLLDSNGKSARDYIRDRRAAMETAGFTVGELDDLVGPKISIQQNEK
jgi:hypothetical protein